MRRSSASCSQGCLQFFYVAEDDLKLLILLPSPKCCVTLMCHTTQLSCPVSGDRKAPCSPFLLITPVFFSQELEKLGLGDSVDLHVYEIPVEYQTVQRLIPALWEKHSPQVSSRAPPRVLPTPLQPSHCSVTVRRCHGHDHSHS